MKKKMKCFLKGMGSVFDPLSIRQSPEVKKILGQTDYETIKNDWNHVGQDINRAIENAYTSFKTKK